MPIIVLILLSLSGGFAYVSKSALPGDVLYPVKVNIDEPIEEALAFGPQALSAVHTNHALERLKEIEQLKNAGKLTPQDEVLTRSVFENEVSKVNTDIEKLNSIKDFKSARTVEKTLRDDLKKSGGLAALYGTAAPAAVSTVTEAAPVQTDTQGAPSVASKTLDTLSSPTTIQSSSTKHVPKMLPQRKNIIRDDDGGAGEDD